MVSKRPLSLLQRVARCSYCHSGLYGVAGSGHRLNPEPAGLEWSGLKRPPRRPLEMPGNSHRPVCCSAF